MNEAQIAGGVVGKRTMPGGWSIRWDERLARRWRDSGDWLELTLADGLADLVASEPGRVLIIEKEREHTASELLAEARRLASALIARGLTQGDVISYQIPNWYEGFIINIAAAFGGFVVNPLVPIYREREVGFMLQDVGTKLVFTPERFRNFDHAAMFAAVNETLADPVQIVVLRGSHPSALTYDALLAEGSDLAEFAAVDPDSPCVVMHTSGTTGRPKCVVHSHNTFLVQAKVHASELLATDHDTQIVATPISHIAGMILMNINAIFGGARSVLMDTWDPQEAVRLVERYQGTSCGGATPFIRGLLDAAKAAGTHLPSLRMNATGGAGIPADLMLEAHEWYPNVASARIFGCTEVPTVTAPVRDRNDVQHGAFLDGMVKHTEVRFVDPASGAPVAWGDEGEILVRGPAMMLGYLRDEDNEGAFDENGFFRTGDLGRIVDGKYLSITGRKKDLIIRNGENLSPKEIEDAILRYPAVRDVAVVGMPDAKTGEAVCAFVVAEPGHSVGLEDITTHLIAEGLAKQKIPVRLEMVDALPVSPQGKVLKVELRERAKALAAA